MCATETERIPRAEGCSVEENQAPEVAVVPLDDSDQVPHDTASPEQLPEVRPKEVRSQDIQERAPDVADGAQVGRE